MLNEYYNLYCKSRKTLHPLEYVATYYANVLAGLDRETLCKRFSWAVTTPAVVRLGRDNNNPIESTEINQLIDRWIANWFGLLHGV